MKKLRQFDVLVIEDLVKEQFPQPTHRQNYYEIVYIFSGSGIHFLNGNPTPYEPEDLFFISPDDTHYLEIREMTHFGAIKFTDSYFHERLGATPNTILRTRPDALMTNRSFKEFKLNMDGPSRELVSRTIQNVLANKERQDLDRSPFVFFQILSLFGLFQEWEARHTDYSWGLQKETLIAFIHQHIYEPEKILIKNVAQTFNISVNYFSTYFRNNFGSTYRQYVNNYRIKLIENRIKAGFTLRQIASEFGFADESHLSHFFKRHNAITFRQYRSESKS